MPQKDIEWFQKKIQKKYPDVCYTGPGPNASLVFLIEVTPAVYHGTRTVTQTQDSPVTGTVTDQSGNVSTVNGTTTTRSSTEVPYETNYGIFTLTLEQVGKGEAKPLHRFQQDGLYPTYAGVPLPTKGHHPVHTVIEEAAKWLHEGGLNDPLQSVAH